MSSEKIPLRHDECAVRAVPRDAIVPFEVYMILCFGQKVSGSSAPSQGLLLGYLVMSFGIFPDPSECHPHIPDELLEAARIDGAGGVLDIPAYRAAAVARCAWRTLAVLAFFQAWTAFAWPIIVATTLQLYDRGGPGVVPDWFYGRRST